MFVFSPPAEPRQSYSSLVSDRTVVVLWGVASGICSKQHVEFYLCKM